ncbi:hypothetical protein JCM3770_001207 [Rhodotorula araucariae]
MGDPLRGSSTSTPDSATSWSAVDREIERLAARSRFLETEAAAAPLLDSGDEAVDPHDAPGRDEDGHGDCSGAVAKLHVQLARRRVVLLMCASVLSVGSHYSMYTLGPIKKSLGTSESSFAGLISALELFNTVTPLLSGFLVPRLGAAACGLAATGAVLLGQLIVCFFSSREGGIGKNVGGVVCGLLIFGSGTSPLAVVQESIILKHNTASSRFVARSVAAGLVLGKTASFAAGWSSQPLYEISPRLPFVAATSLAFFSFAACTVYALVERSTARIAARATSYPTPAGAAPKAARDPAAHHAAPLRLSSLARFGPGFWWYLAVCVLAGAWYATQHLSTHLLQAVYALPAAEASRTAAVLLGMPVLLYPLVGWVVDRRPDLLQTFWLLVPSLTATTYFILLLLSPAIPPLLALLPAAVGMGSGPLLLVLVVPRLVQPHQASTALGAHKSLEMAGAIIFQTLSGALLSVGAAPSRPVDTGTGTSEGEGYGDEPGGGADAAIALLLAAALVQLALVARWWSGIRQRSAGLDGAVPVSAGREEGDEGDEAQDGLLAERPAHARGMEMVQAEEEDGEYVESEDEDEELLGRKERLELTRGRRALRAAVGTVVASWGCFVWNLVRG